MATWKCQECDNILENRCKPGKCKVCGATKDKLFKEEQEKGQRRKGAVTAQVNPKP
ncbi:MAG TPA: radical SAM protein [Desulfotomaculum sp.]|nr:radical SAM protein [Desulfotomaculum sp.]